MLYRIIAGVQYRKQRYEQYIEQDSLGLHIYDITKQHAEDIRWNAGINAGVAHHYIECMEFFYDPEIIKLLKEDINSIPCDDDEDTKRKMIDRINTIIGQIKAKCTSESQN